MSGTIFCELRWRARAQAFYGLMQVQGLFSIGPGDNNAKNTHNFIIKDPTCLELFSIGS